MDCSWLLEEADLEESLDSETSDCEEVEQELESRLYSIVHHNDLSQPLPFELSKHYSLHRSDDGDVTVSLKHSLDQLKSEESKTVDNILESTEVVDKEELEPGEIIDDSDGDNNDVVIIYEGTNDKKKASMSDVNNDVLNESKNKINTDHLNNKQREFVTEVSHSIKGLNDFDQFRNINTTIYNFSSSDINIPSFLDSSDWKSNVNAAFIPIRSNAIRTNDPLFKLKIIKALQHLNPGIKRKKLERFTELLLKRNVTISNLAEKKKQDLQEFKLATRQNLINGLDDLTNLPIEVEDKPFVNDETNDIVINCNSDHLQLQQKANKNRIVPLNLRPSRINATTINSINEDVRNYKSKSQNKERINGSVFIDVSPFKPISLTTEVDSQHKKDVLMNTLQSYIPTKWTKKMIAFYTVPFKDKMNTDINSIFLRFNKKTKAEDWWLDPLDWTGVYHRPVTTNTKSKRRCKNCNERNHTALECPQPKKILACFLCGELYHSGYSCPKIVCLKCGIYNPEWECLDCYYHTFQCGTPCERCGSFLHRTPNCPDSWRRFHATTEGELKIPKMQLTNRRRFCCNCAHYGHFSHKCLMPASTHQQISPFVVNYSNEPLQQGSTEIFVSKRYQEIINSPEADQFLQGLSNTSKTQIEFESVNNGFLLKVNGTFEQCTNVSSEIEAYVNNKKRKREEPPFRRKRQRLK